MSHRPRSASELATRLGELTTELGEPLTLDGLTRDFQIFQRRRGHRTSTDDLLTAWYAATHPPATPRTMLDLGTGIGSVGLSLAWRFPDVALSAIEVQSGSFRLFTENVWANGVEARVHAIQGDLRDLRDAVPSGEFDLVTGSPPYFDVKSGIVSADPQRAGARFELRGDVRDYCRAAAAKVAPDGRFVFCFPTVQRERAIAACEAAALPILARRDVVPKEGLAPLFSLFVCASARAPAGREALPVTPMVEAPFVVRDANGAHTAEMTAARALFGMATALR